MHDKQCITPMNSSVKRFEKLNVRLISTAVKSGWLSDLTAVLIRLVVKKIKITSTCCISMYFNTFLEQRH